MKLPNKLRKSTAPKDSGGMPIPLTSRLRNNDVKKGTTIKYRMNRMKK